jgi:signal transduction histidine kinase
VNGGEPKVAASPAIPLAVAGTIAATALALRLVDPRAGFPGLTPAALPLLFVAACLCAAALLRDRFPPGAWFAIVTAAGLSALEVVGSVRAWEPHAGPDEWPWLVSLAELGLLGAALVAAAYALAGRARPAAPLRRAVRLLILAWVAAIALVCAWAVAVTFAGWVPAGTVAADADLPPLRLSGRVATAFVWVSVGVGLWRDLADPIRRARTEARQGGDLPAALANQLFPTASGSRRRGREEERARLAADLHALVLPDLRRAARAAEESGVVGQPLAADVRNALEGVERLMHERQSVVFEEFGLVAALEWLAERTQDQANVEVAVELEGLLDDPETLPRHVTRAAFRVAILAVDNALRHAEPSRIQLRLEIRSGSLALAIVDDGTPGDRDATSRGGRGLLDMRSAAAEVDGALDVRMTALGTTIEFRWAGIGQEHPTPDAAPADTRIRPHH